MSAQISVADLWRSMTAQLRNASIATPELDARMLCAHATGYSETTVIIATDIAATDAQTAMCQAMVARRVAGEPVARIIGTRSFWKHDFEVTPATLDPRADSETLVELTLQVAKHEVWTDRQIKVLDLGTGTGCLLLSILGELPNAHGIGVDISDAALDVARRNAQNLGLSDRASFARSSWLENIEGTFDVVISNPPYIETAEISDLAPEVRDHDPVTALDGGADGLDAYHAIIDGLSRVQVSGWMIFEIGMGQETDVLELLRAANYCDAPADLTMARDLAGVVRCVAGRKK